MTHNTTGLQYLGMREEGNLDDYNGSGKYWKLHLEEYGDNLTKEILLESDDVELFDFACLEASLHHDVVESKAWANACYETGTTGSNLGYKHAPDYHKGASNPMYGQTQSPEIRERMSANSGRRKGAKALEITHIATGQILGIFKGKEELVKAGFQGSDPHSVAKGRFKSCGRKLPDGTREKAAYTAKYVN